MSAKAATIRERRINFRAVKGKVEKHGQITIARRGLPPYTLKAVEPRAGRKAPRSDNYSRLLRRQPKPLSPEKTRQFWDEERG